MLADLTNNVKIQLPIYGTWDTPTIQNSETNLFILTVAEPCNQAT